jgi:hypothetical protein
MLDNPCAALEPWLATLDPRQELITRLALRGCFHQFAGNRHFIARIAELTRILKLGSSDLTALLEEARMIEARLDSLADPRDAPEKLRA